jgi:hypothetical protein
MVPAGHRSVGQPERHDGQLRQCRSQRLRGPGTNNWDTSISKRFQLFKDGRSVQFREETFNTFNHTHYSGVDSGTSFNPSAGAQTSLTFGQVNAAPRRMALSPRVVF